MVISVSGSLVDVRIIELPQPKSLTLVKGHHAATHRQFGTCSSGGWLLRRSGVGRACFGIAHSTEIYGLMMALKGSW